ncbi:hypothetical protein PIB30_104291, partial [Stylosanthes scabra]|nr:hypothetical protein [Stylosanthes scabra]
EAGKSWKPENQSKRPCPGTYNTCPGVESNLNRPKSSIPTPRHQTLTPRRQVSTPRRESSLAHDPATKSPCLGASSSRLGVGHQVSKLPVTSKRPSSHAQG